MAVRPYNSAAFVNCHRLSTRGFVSHATNLFGQVNHVTSQLTLSRQWGRGALFLIDRCTNNNIGDINLLNSKYHWSVIIIIVIITCVHNRHYNNTH